VAAAAIEERRQLADDEGRNQDRERRVARGFPAGAARDPREDADVARLGLTEHERPERFGRAREEGRLRDPSGAVGTDRVLILLPDKQGFSQRYPMVEAGARYYLELTRDQATIAELKRARESKRAVVLATVINLVAGLGSSSGG